MSLWNAVCRGESSGNPSPNGRWVDPPSGVSKLACGTWSSNPEPNEREFAEGENGGSLDRDPEFGLFKKEKEPSPTPLSGDGSVASSGSKARPSGLWRSDIIEL